MSYTLTWLKPLIRFPMHADLSHKLAQFGITGILNKWFQSYPSNRFQRVVLEGTYSDWLEVSSGVPLQGSVLGQILFLLYTNDMPSYLLQNSSLMLFADDSKLYKVINNNSDIISLQEYLTNLHRWSIDSSMNFSTTKCKVLNISRKVNSLIRPYVIDGNPLEVVTDTVDLGILVTNNLSCSKHIDSMTTKQWRS